LKSTNSENRERRRFGVNRKIILMFVVLALIAVS